MTDIPQSYHLQNTHYELRGKVSAMALKLEAQGHQLLKLHLGNPGLFNLDAPAALIDCVSSHLQASQAYCHSKGLPQAREAILQHWQRNNGPGVHLDNILMGNGVSELINVVLQALVNPGDEILLPRPTYPLWSAATTLCGGVCRYYDCFAENEWQPDIDHLESLVTPRTRAIVVINPNNPTGSLYSTECLQAIARIAATHQLVLFSDEIYSDIVYEPHQFEAMAPHSQDTFTVTFRGLSKNYLLAGYRCAWMVVSGTITQGQDYLNGINKLLEMRLCPNVPAQYAVPMALSDPAFTLLQHHPEMVNKRNQVVDRLNQIEGLHCHRPAGAFYAYPSWEPAVCCWDHDEQWVFEFLQQHRILLAPGSTFAQNDPYHFRIAMLPDTQALLDACDCLEEFIVNYSESKTMPLP